MPGLLNPAGLLLSLTALFPIILHFFERLSAPDEVLPTFPLLGKIISVRKRSPHRLLLLIIRVLILVFLGVFLAKPVWIAVEDHGRPDTIILIDNGPGMARILRGRTILEHARGIAGRLHAKYSAAGRVSVLSLRPYPGEKPGLQGREAIRAVKLSAFPSDPFDTGERIRKITAGRFGSYKLVIIGSGGPLFDSEGLRLDMPVVYRYLRPAARKNIAITGISGLPSMAIAGKVYRMGVQLDNSGSSYGRGNRLTVMLGDEVVAVRAVDIPEGRTTLVVPVRLHSGTGRLLTVHLAEDESSFDNRHARLMGVRERLRVRLYPPLDRDPYLRAVFRAISMGAVEWTTGEGRDVLHCFTDSTTGADGIRGLRLLFPSSSPAPVLTLSEGDVTIRVRPEITSNSRTVVSAFPGGRDFPFRFTGVPVRRVEYNTPVRPLFRDNTGRTFGALYSRPGTGIGVFPFSSAASESLFLHPGFPDFMMRLVDILFSEQEGIVFSPVSDQIRAAVPGDGSGRWAGTSFINAEGLMTANIHRNWYRMVDPPGRAQLRRETGSSRVSVIRESANNSVRAASVSLGWIVLLLVFLLKLLELHLLRKDA